MVSNLSTIGFTFGDDAGFRAAMARLADAAIERLACEGGEYAIWRSRTGAEIWFHLAPASDSGGERQIVGLTPFFEGHSELVVEVERLFQRDGDTALEGSVTGWVAPEASAEDGSEADDLGVGAYPIVFDAVDFAALAGRELPDVWRVRLAGFARELKAHADEAAFHAADAGPEPKLAAQAFLPIGLYDEAEDGEAESAAMPRSIAVLTGRVVEHTRLVNEESGSAFHWLLVESLAATYDIIADPEIVSGEIVQGGTVEVACWLFGRILADD